MDSRNNEGNNGHKGVDDLSVDSTCAVAAMQKTYVSIFHELCTKFDFGMPIYDLIGESGEAHKKSFRISLTVEILGISVAGKANTKMQAKHDAASKMMMQLKKTTQIRVLNMVTEENLMKCSEWMKQFEFQNEGAPSQQPTAETKNPSGILTTYALTKQLEPPVYNVVSTTGPAHCKQFVMTCKMNGHLTVGEGKNKKICKNVAAEEMLLILRGQIQD